MLGLIILVFFLVPPAIGIGVTVRLTAESDGSEGGRWTRTVSEEWAKRTGNKLEYISRPNDVSAALATVSAILDREKSRRGRLPGRRDLAGNCGSSRRRSEEVLQRR